MLEFAQAIADAGMGAPCIIQDGNIHRFTAPDDKPGSNNCWYVSFGSGGAAGSWKTGQQITWYDKANRSHKDDAALAKQIRAAQKQRKSEMAHGHKKTQEEARYLWASGSERKRSESNRRPRSRTGQRGSKGPW